MNTVVVADIFGCTDALGELCTELGPDVLIVDPYDGQRKDFTDDQHAYDYFSENVGIDRYCENLASQLKTLATPCTLIGFSVGASVVWKMTASLNSRHVMRALIFYGSQIRHLSELEPRVPVDIIFPAHEDGFSVAGLIDQLSDKKNVKSRHTPYLHGFMNRLSANYSAEGYKSYLNWLSHRL